jgi:hypothetical protein
LLNAWGDVICRASTAAAHADKPIAMNLFAVVEALWRSLVFGLKIVFKMWNVA